MSLKVGVIGTGLYGERHVQAYTQNRDVELLAVADLRAERVAEIAARYDVPHHLTDYRNLLALPEIQAVSIATPDPLHREVAVAAAAAGKHILVEKPMATSVEDATAIVEAARSAGIHLMVDFHNRWSPAFCHLKDALAAGELGEARLINVRLNNTFAVPEKMLRWAADSAPTWFLGSHCLDLCNWLLQDRPVRVQAVSREGVLKERGVAALDFVEAIVEYSRGAVVVLENCWILPDSLPTVKDFQFELVGSRGATYLDLSHNRTIEKYGEKALLPDLYAYPKVRDRYQGFVGYAIDAFVDAVLNGRAPSPSGEEGLLVTETICAILDAARTGRPVDLA